eukprot:TRINITY_DN1849_c0_g1_i1.p1 TRINITY_DN1849_c0_g1~~TRINITY_DN1849_c0_g1_i1.p1  ORF type:complete len:519 (+),score=106.62 TRINITY_DN1849_c0_g1_i1:215-1771(+)
MKLLIIALLVSLASASVWPLPTSVTSSTDPARTVTPGTSFFSLAGGAAVPTLTAAFQRYTDLTFPHRSTASANDALAGLQLTVTDLDESHPQLHTDESYLLTVPSTGAATISASTIYGAMRGLESFSQLVSFNFTTETYSVAPVVIKDAPRFPHRGLMMDSARHFETLASIRHVIDSLPYAKLNVLHWHMVDSQSFPFQSKAYPKLWAGAYSEVEKFTQADIATIVEYARMRGVRVIVEFDMPGHAGSWCVGYPEICPSPTCTQPLNVANNFTFTLIDGLLGDCTGRKASTKGSPSGLFPDDFLHLGGDEVDTSCWTKTASVAAWLTAQNMTADDGYAYFAHKVSEIAIAQGRSPVQWSEVYDHFKTKLDKRTIVHIWKGNTNVTEVVANGYQVLLNVGYDADSWYLDNLAVNWSAVYSNEPCTGVPDDLCPMILGGHGEMWGETVDASDVQQTVWPRLAAIAERLWSPRDQVGDIPSALPRIEEFRCLLNRRGIDSAPVNNANARASPPGPGSCLVQ